ncbi:helicase domino-like, partial [Centruroides sculpturatus]|uniref:helicase domino-like n=1 Tax=Centruroides sculpturatus TaxID=218467 RepID=UPI000C6D04DA
MIQGSGETNQEKKTQQSQHDEIYVNDQQSDLSQIEHSLTTEQILSHQVSASQIHSFDQHIASSQQNLSERNLNESSLSTTNVEGAVSTGNAIYQHYLIPSVSLGGQIQNIAIPSEVATLSVQDDSHQSISGTQPVDTTTSYTISSEQNQNLARILATQSHQTSEISVSGISTPDQISSLENTSGLNTAIQLQKVSCSGCTVLTVPIVSATMSQRNIVADGRQGNVVTHLSSSSISSSQDSQQTMLDTVMSTDVLHTDVTKVHSYSLASATPTLSTCTGNVYHPVGMQVSSGILSVPASPVRQNEHLTLISQSGITQNRTVGAIVDMDQNISPSNISGIVQTTVNNLNVSLNNSVISTSNLNMSLVSSDSSPVNSPRPKRIKLEEKPPADEETASMRKKICDYRNNEIKSNKEKYQEHLAELFFLQSGGNIMDYLSWRRRPVQQFLAFLKTNALESDGEEESSDTDNKTTITTTAIPTVLSSCTPSITTTSVKQGSTVDNTSKSLSSTVTTTSSSQSSPSRPANTSTSRSTSGSGIPSTPKLSKSPPSVTLPTNRLHTRQHYISAVYDSAIGSQEEIVERAKQEAYVMQRISELRREGLWSAKRLPKVQEPPRTKAHWDYLLEEMVWLAADFAQERKWKKAAAKKVKFQFIIVIDFIGSTVDNTSKSLSSTVTTTSSSQSSPSRPANTSTSRSTSGSGIPSTPKLSKSPPSVTLPTNRLHTRQHYISAVYDSAIGSQEEIVERAKQEAYVMQRISELRREGLWSAKRLPKVQEPPRTKAHWDYLLEEMVWLAADFAQERKWKKAAAKKCSRMVLKYHQEREMKAERAEKEEHLKLRKIASQIAKEIKQFWTNIEKLVEFKQQTRLEEKRKKALDLHLNFIVDQTEKYSSWLTQGMNQSIFGSTPTSLNETSGSQAGSDDKDFEPNTSETDDEETIEKEEAQGINKDEQDKEIQMLQKESELPLEELLKTLPSNILEKPASPFSCNEESSSRNESEDQFENKDDEYYLSNDDIKDDESTIQEQESKESKEDYDAELKELQELNDIPLEELVEKYAAAYASDVDISTVESSSNSEENEGSDLDDEDEMDDDNGKTSTSNKAYETEENDDDDEEDDMDEEEEDDEIEFGTDDEDEIVDVGMEYLINPEKEHSNKEEEKDETKNRGPSQEITDIAAAAESFQPKGNTLSTTQVCTKIPFLLKHQLREYQHIGLDWLVTMHDRKLNGILADEMGLGKTIQTIALLAHLACEKGIWGPHLIVVPTSVMLNWEMEFKKWCPAFKIITYYGTPKERRQKRQGWTKPNAFHVCITSYKLVIQDHYSFRRKKWKYFILDEAQHIKNFKSQRWQMLLNFHSSRRLLLTGTPLQNSLMELWSLMHFLMPNVFQSHREFRDWFANPVTGMIEGSHEYNESLIKRLHKVLRPFLLRRLKSEVEKQLPKKYEHVIMCRLSKRQRYLYDDFMSQTKTKETLTTGNFMSVINVLMQLRKVCNHPNLFESRPTVSPFMMEGICFYLASLVGKILEYDPFKNVNLWSLNLLIIDLELYLTAFAAHRIKKFQTSARFIEDINSQPEPAPRCPPGKLRLQVKAPNQTNGSTNPGTSPKAPAIVRTAMQGVTRSTLVSSPISNQQQRIVVVSGPNSAPSSRATSPVAAIGIGNNPTINQTSSTEYTLQLIQQSTSSNFSVAQLTPVSLASQMVTTTPITVQIQQTGQGGARLAMPLGIGRLVQTATGQHILLTPASTVGNANSETLTLGQFQQSVAVTPTIAGNVSASVVVQVPPIATPSVYTQANKFSISANQPILTSNASSGIIKNLTSGISTIATTKPVVRVAPLNINPVSNTTVSGSSVYSTKSPVMHIPTKPVTRSDNQSQLPFKTDYKKNDNRKSIFYMESLVEKRNERQKEKLERLGYINARRCVARPLYGLDLIKTVTVVNDIQPCSQSKPWHGMGYVNCYNAPYVQERCSDYWYYTQALSSMIHTPESYLEELKDIITRYVFVVPGVTAPQITMHTSHPSPSAVNEEKHRVQFLHQELSARCSLLHPITSNTRTQFPELRLIQYDCGKLQTLDKLLWQLKSEGHRVLIFTQMTRMLDVFEQFLNHHGHTYLRLDGTTRVDQRQVLMERFNADRRIFCFILSTRSGGIGVNLTGADTVIFYDSDWNPTMDAQAQDRCHRIGQTRDVHIYRLISERTVEENILKKANQKRLLGDLAIEGGNFTTAFFKKNTIRDLFGIDLSVSEEVDIKGDDDNKPNFELEEKLSEGDKLTQTQFEQALGMAEEELDVQAAKTARAEAAAELAEFDESIPIDVDSRDNEEKSQAEEELDKLMEQLSPVEKYAMQFLESLQEPFSLEQLKQAEEEIEAQKKDWELGRLKALKEEEERRAAKIDDDEEPLLTYGREDAYTQVAKTNKSLKGRGTKCLGKRNRGGSCESGNSTLNTKTPQRRSKRIIIKREFKDNSEMEDKGKMCRKTKKVVNHVDEKLLTKTNSKVNCYPLTTTTTITTTTITTSNGPNKTYDSNECKNKISHNILSGVGSKIKNSATVPLPFSNPNLVIRTRRASARQAEAEKLKQESDVEIDVVTVNSSELSFGHLGTNKYISLKQSSPNSRISPEKHVKKSKFSSLKQSQESSGEEQNGVYISSTGKEQMPIWAPPTPPQEENDLYIDYSMGFLYEHTIMPESQLPPIYVKKETKRLKVDN